MENVNRDRNKTKGKFDNSQCDPQYNQSKSDEKYVSNSQRTVTYLKRNYCSLYFDLQYAGNEFISTSG